MSYLPSKSRRIFGPGSGDAAGTTDMGKTLSRLVQIPFALTDRADGTVWYVSSNTRAEGAFPAVPRIALNTEKPAGGLVNPIIYTPGSEPILNGSNLQIFVRGGRLGFEQKTPHIYAGPRWVVAPITLWYSVRYELKTAPGFTWPTGRLSFETQPEW